MEKEKLQDRTVTRANSNPATRKVKENIPGRKAIFMMAPGKRACAKDSLLTGFWKKDVYQGRFEKPYKVLAQSSKVSTVSVTKNPGSKNPEITIVISNTSGNTTKTDISATAASGVPKMKLTDIDIQKGNYMSKLDLDNAERSTKSIIRGVEFPFKATFRIEGEMVQIEFFEEGNYTVEINILQ